MVLTNQKLKQDWEHDKDMKSKTNVRYYNDLNIL